MRLRYLHLPQCGPLIDTSVVFGREERIAQTLNLQRKGSLNFVVGVNGTGKSSLLRTIYGIYRSLNKREKPALPVTLAWDRTIGGKTRTTLLHYTNQKTSQPFVATFKMVPASANRSDWAGISIALNQEKEHPLIEGLDMSSGPEIFTDSLLISQLPKRLIAYTSGPADLWLQVDHPIYHPKQEDDGFNQAEEERPQGWSLGREAEEVQPARISNILTRFALESGANRPYLPTSGAVLPEEALDQVRQELVPLDELRKKVYSNAMLRKDGLDDSYFHINPHHLRYAGIAMALLQAEKELADHNQDIQREKLRDAFQQQRTNDDNSQDARRVLNKIDWFWPTHLSITYRDMDDRVNSKQHRELACLVALADEIVAQPLDCVRAVFSLGPSDRIGLTDKLQNAFKGDIPDRALAVAAARVDNCKTGAGAILRIFSEDDNVDSTPMDVFNRLRDWERSGLLKEITLTVKRISQTQSPIDQPDDLIVTYEQLSDGEQMFLGRMGLLSLLRGQDGSLLLFDEPETHFNDVWKREIVEMVDMGLLNNTAVNVIISTHTSIALTDAFAAEVTLLADGKATDVALPLFGADPGRLFLRVFGAKDMIGVRAAKLLRAKLSQVTWTDEEKEALRLLIDETGSGWQRAQLMEILDRLDNPDVA